MLQHAAQDQTMGTALLYLFQRHAHNGLFSNVFHYVPLVFHFSTNLSYFDMLCAHVSSFFLQVRVSGVAALSGAMRSLSSTFSRFSRFRDGNAEHASSYCTASRGQWFVWMTNLRRLASPRQQLPTEAQPLQNSSD